MCRAEDTFWKLALLCFMGSGHYIDTASSRISTEPSPWPTEILFLRGPLHPDVTNYLPVSRGGHFLCIYCSLSHARDHSRTATTKKEVLDYFFFLNSSLKLIVLTAPSRGLRGRHVVTAAASNTLHCPSVHPTVCVCSAPHAAVSMAD